ncbi:zinc finger CCCH-type domain protein [Faustovirus]|nr:hypothetical protein F-LCD7_0457 [Faustovirus]QJX72224.1 hypothetical protein F-M6_0461 [Faustovirus]QJX72719.1 zinc finger CCCH-type domain protein [Faustovirus]QJX73216.1 zinc finger CCCH-type domain protein [Faustovirus]QJX73723.1 H-zinc finger CCCH-type protein [Faustovirus]
MQEYINSFNDLINEIYKTSDVKNISANNIRSCLAISGELKDIAEQLKQLSDRALVFSKKISERIHNEIEAINTIIDSPIEAINDADGATEYVQVGVNSVIPVTDTVALNAVVVRGFSDVKRDSRVYYVENANHFAFYLNDNLYHGNIGKIYTNEKNPKKIKPCKFLSTCNSSKCDYYHDPMLMIGSCDVRNFVSTSWAYERGRKIGSVINLDVELKAIERDDAERYIAQTTHDILVSTLLFQYRKA